MRSPHMQESSVDILLPPDSPSTDSQPGKPSVIDNSPSSNHKAKYRPTPKAHQLFAIAAQSAKHELQSRLRSDWVYPPLSSQPSSPIISTGSPIKWRPRDSDSSSQTPSSPHLTSPEAPSDPYKYENPDSFAHLVLNRKHERHTRLQDEMSWNEGLAIFVHRRDTWSGARELPPLDSGPSDAGYISPNCFTTGTTLPASSSSSPISPVVPVAPPFLASNPLRASINASAYPVLYSKIVIQGLTPKVPVNLSDMVRALVEGWKSEGEWPPKSEAEVENENIEAIVRGSQRDKQSLTQMKIMKEALELTSERDQTPTRIKGS